MAQQPELYSIRDVPKGQLRDLLRGERLENGHKDDLKSARVVRIVAGKTVKEGDKIFRTMTLCR